MLAGPASTATSPSTSPTSPASTTPAAGTAPCSPGIRRKTGLNFISDDVRNLLSILPTLWRKRYFHIHQQNCAHIYKYRWPSLFGGVMFLECSANDKTADNKGVLFSPKRLIFEAKCEKSLNNRWKISGIKMKLQKYKPQLANQRTKRTTCMHNNCRSKAQLLHLLVQKLLIKCRCNWSLNEDLL